MIFKHFGSERSTLQMNTRSVPVRETKKYSIFYREYFPAIPTQARIEHNLPLPMTLMGEPLANYAKSIDCRWELANSEAWANTGNYPTTFTPSSLLNWQSTNLRPSILWKHPSSDWKLIYCKKSLFVQISTHFRL
jgi:hypothetical protein